MSYNAIMRKGYIHKYELSKEPGTRSTFWFDSRPENAWVWESKEEAESVCRLFDSYPLEIPSGLGGTHICRNFTIEERKSGGFTIFCKAPFISESVVIDRQK
jgi:hypothetical protein